MFNNMFQNVFGTLAPETDQYATGYDPRMAQKAAIGGVLKGLGMGLATNDWGRAVELAGSGAEDYQRQQARKAQMQDLMFRAEENRRKREEEQQASQQREQFLSTLPADVQMKARSIPGFLEKYIEATDPTFQNQQEVKRYNVGGALVDEDGNVIYQSDGAGDGISADIMQRKQAAESLGLTQDHPAYQSYILTGRMPREDQAPLTATDKKAILEADDAVMTNQAIIDQLNSIITPDQSGKSLNDRAGYGVTAGAQSWAARNDPTGGYLFDQEQGQATTDLSNIVLGQALTSLKSIFGAAPTEGERKILVDLQASVDKTPKERESIIKRAISLAQMRLAFNRKRAESLRGETYYKPGGSPQSITTEDGITIEQVGE